MVLETLSLDVTLNLSFLAVLAGGLLYLYGRIIDDTKPVRKDKVGIQLDGFVFASKFILVPAVIVYFIVSSSWFPGYIAVIWKSTWFFVILSLIQVIVLISWLSINIDANHLLRKLGLKEYVEDKIEEVLEEKGLGSIKEIVEAIFGLKAGRLLTRVYYDYNRRIVGTDNFLYFSGFFTFLWVSNALKYPPIVIFFAILITAYTTLMMAGVYGYKESQYTKISVETENDKFDGRLINTGDQFLSMRKEQDIISVNKDKIETITRKVLED